MILRLRQGLRALASPFLSVDFEMAAKVLSPSLMVLFRQMRRSEQQHSLNVLRTLRGWGYDEPPLMVAALLHDVGKSRVPYHLWDRVLVVLARNAAPNAVEQWGAFSPTGWYRPFAVSVQHPQWSAEMVKAAGADPVTIELIVDHQCYLDHSPKDLTERMLWALQTADNAN
ncbi:MAG: HD domain-containing protein [Chloroflexota bacterium]